MAPLDNTEAFTFRLVLTLSFQGVLRYGKDQHMASVDKVWRRIVTLEGETFCQKRQKAFTYAVFGDSLKPSTTNRQLPRSHSARALARIPSGAWPASGPAGAVLPLRHLD